MEDWTPGPWLKEGNSVVYDSRHEICCGKITVYGCCGEPDIGGEYFEVAKCAEHDAALIAAAPDLYEALLAAANSAGFQYMVGETRDMIQRALDKARGEQT